MAQKDIFYKERETAFWEEEELQVLRDAVKMGLDAKDLSDKLPNRTFHAIRLKLKKLKQALD